MTKKKFTISDSLAKGIKNTVNTASENRGQLQYELMNIDVIELDPENPRKLSLTKQDMQSRQTIDKKKLDEIESLQALAESIKRAGVRNAIEVYKEGKKYRLISGERRLLASILAGKTNIPARVNNKPDEFKLRYLQWIENIHREDLSLWEKYINLKQLMTAHNEQRKERVDGTTIADILGISSSQAYRYFSLLNADEELLNLVKAGKLSSLKLLDEIAHIKSKEVKNSAITALRDNLPTHVVQNQLQQQIKSDKKVKPSLVKNESRGRKSQHINFGKTHNLKTARKVCESIRDHREFENVSHVFNEVDWSSPQSISQAFKKFLSIVEQMG